RRGGLPHAWPGRVRLGREARQGACRHARPRHRRMSARPPLHARAPLTARTRVCPHCKATILESANVCPGCRHHLKFDSVEAQRQAETRTALRIDGTIKAPNPAEPCEYSVVIAIRDERGQEVGR